MQITGVTQTHLEYPLGGTWEPTWIPGYPQGAHEAELFEIETDEGITGITASPSFAGGFDYETPLDLFLTGEDPYDVEGVLRKLDTIDLLGPRPWHLEIALWDIIGKDTGQPIHRLMGADAEPIPVYASTGELQPPEERIDYVEDRIDEGVEAVKLRFQHEDVEDDLEVARQVRAAFPDLTLMVDANMGWSARAVREEHRWSFKEAVRVCRELEDLGGVAWLEEPLDRHAYRRYADLRARTDVPIAGGEFNDGLHHFREFVRHDALDIIQPDAMLATGLLRGRKAAAMADAEGIEFAPHTWTNGIGLAANLHLMAATEAPWCEYPMEPPWTPASRDFMLTEPITHDDGAIAPPDGPGLGVELDRDAVAEYGSRPGA